LINLKRISMTNKSMIFGTLSEALECIPTASMDSTFENSTVVLLRKLDAEHVWRIVGELLTHPKAKARALGLRLVRRQFKDKEMLERVIHLCFTIERLAELQYWYAAILARYPVMRFLRKLEAEATSRQSADFIARHVRALQMHKADGSRAKKAALAELVAFALTKDWARSNEDIGSNADKLPRVGQ